MTTLTQLQLNQTDINCGMSNIFLLDNRHFFIIDGGFFTPGEDEKLYKEMKSVENPLALADGMKTALFIFSLIFYVLLKRS